MIQGLGVKHIDSIWPTVWAVLARAFAYSAGEFSEQKVYNELKSQSMQLWLDVRENKIIAAGTTQLKIWPEKKICMVIGFAAESDELLAEYLAVIEDWAKDYGADEVHFSGRKGWERKAKALGYDFRHVTVAKKLGE